MSPAEKAVNHIIQTSSVCLDQFTKLSASSYHCKEKYFAPPSCIDSHPTEPALQPHTFMPRQQSYHRQNTQRRSNQYYSALINTGTYTSELNSAEAHYARYIARTQVVHDTTQNIEIRREASRDLRQHGQSQTRRRVAPLATLKPLIPTITITCPCFSQNDLICLC